MPGQGEIADLCEVVDLRERARQARYLAWRIGDEEAGQNLLRRAEELETRADAIEARHILAAGAGEALPPNEPSRVQTGVSLNSDQSLSAEPAPSGETPELPGANPA